MRASPRPASARASCSIFSTRPPSRRQHLDELGGACMVRAASQAGCDDLGLGACGGDGIAELMRTVGSERTFRFQSRLEPFEQPIHIVDDRRKLIRQPTRVDRVEVLTVAHPDLTLDLDYGARGPAVLSNR